VWQVDGDTLHLSSIDLVHGTPVLDIKPYIPHDCLPGATFPGWCLPSLSP
jgi:tRNA (Thr-GGU) A37 N-methylase